MTDVHQTPGPAPSRRRRRMRRPAEALAVVGIIAVIAAGCGSSPSSTSSGTTAAPPASATTAAGAGQTVPSTRITATLTEFHIALSRTTFTPGSYTFHVVNSGNTIHSITFAGPDGSQQGLKSDLQPGQSANLTVNLQAGAYDVFCPVGDHKALGMNLEITVSASGTSGAPTTTAPANTSGQSSRSSGGVGS